MNEPDTLLLEFHKLFNYGDDNDRSIAIIGATFLETLLEHILEAFLIDNNKEVKKLFDYNGPLGNFSSKINLAYCLGLIYKPVKEDLNLVRKIRNKFAHELQVSFEEEEIEAWCKSLKWHRIVYVANPPKDASAKMLFEVGVNQLITNLIGMISLAKGQKRKLTDVSGVKGF